MASDSIDDPGEHSLDYQAPAAALREVYLDAALLVVDKPAGLLSVPGRGAARADCAALRARALAEDALTVHRLDMGTSGLLLFARGAGMQRLLSGAFMRREVDKHYIAVVRGEVAGDSGEIALPLAADWPRRPRQKVDPEHGKPALTRWEVLARLPGRTRLRLEPITGRSHQLRVHLAALGHPILGDALYGGDTQSGERMLLHAQSLSLSHPITGQRMEWRSEPRF